jgi:hypothetical protein
LIAAGLQFYGSQVCQQMKDGMTELIIQKVTVNNMDVMFALCTSPKPVLGIKSQVMIDSIVDRTGRTKYELMNRD